jgi:Skp family chaperone for outer membrane proteins
VKKNHWITLIAGIAIILGIYSIPATSQQAAPAAPSLPYLIAVVDIAQVIKAHPDFQAKQNALQNKVKDAEAKFQVRQEAIAKKQRDIDALGLQPNSPERQRYVDGIANDMAEFEKDAKILQRQFAMENSRIMFDTYKDIKGTIEKYATARGIAQVTDYRDFEVNPDVPETVAEDMDQRLVWYNRNLNITQFILKDLYTARNLPYPPAQTAAPQQPGTVQR